MKCKLILGILLLLSIQAFSQEKKWSVEANYPIVMGDENLFLNNATGIIDIGLKYRFADFSFMKVGAGFNAGFFADSETFRFSEGSEDNLLFDSKTKIFLIQPKVFAEFDIPFAERLKPFVGLGYSVIVTDVYFFNGNEVRFDDTSTDGGFNANLGLSYDITKSLFIQAQYDFITQKIENEALGLKSNISSNLVKVGVGFRF